VDVNFEVNIQNKLNGENYNLNELHPMRYFFKPELEFLADKTGMELFAYYDWMSFEQPTEKSWYAVFLMKPKINE
jgi:hypothetical protein